MTWQERGFESELEYQAYLLDLRRKLGSLDADTFNRLSTSGTKSDFERALGGDVDFSTPKLTEPDTTQPKYPKGEAGIIPTLDPIREFDEITKKRAEDAQRSTASRSTYDTPITPEDIADPEKAARIERDLAQKAADRPVSDLGERVGPWYEAFATPAPNDSWWSYLNPIRPQVILNEKQAREYAEAKERGEASTWKDTLLDVMSRETSEGRVVESLPAWLTRMLNIPSALVATGLDVAGSAAVGADNVPLAHRIAQGEGIADVAREAATAAKFGERYPDPDKVGDEYTIPERAAFMGGFLADIALPLDLGLGELGGVARRGLAMQRAGISPKLPEILRGFDAVKAAAKDPENISTVQAWLSHVVKGDKELPPEVKPKADALHLPDLKDNEGITDLLGTGLQRNVLGGLVGEVPPPEQVLERSLGQKVVRDMLQSTNPYEEIRIGDVLIPAFERSRLDQVIAKSPLAEAAKAAKVEGGEIVIPRNLLAPLDPGMQYTKGTGDTVTLALSDWNTLVTDQVEQAARLSPYAVDLTKTDKINPQRLTPAEVRVNTLTDSVSEYLPIIRNILNPTPTLTPKVGAAVTQALDEAKLQLGSVGQEIMQDIKVARKRIKDTHGAFSQVVYDTFAKSPDDAMVELVRRVYGDGVVPAARAALAVPTSPLSKIRGVILSDPGQAADRLARVVEFSRGHSLGVLTGEHPSYLANPEWSSMVRRTPLEGIPENAYATVIGTLVHTRQMQKLPEILRGLRHRANLAGSKAYSSHAIRGRNVFQLVKGHALREITSTGQQNIQHALSEFVADLFGGAVTSGMYDDVGPLDTLVTRLTEMGVPKEEAERLAMSIELDHGIRNQVKESIELMHRLRDISPEQIKEITKVAVGSLFPKEPTLLQQRVADLMPPELLLDAHPTTVIEIAKSMSTLVDTKESAAALWEAMGGREILLPITDEARKALAAIGEEEILRAIENPEVAKAILPVLPTQWQYNEAVPIRTWNTVSNLARQGMLSGYLLPNFAYHMVNFASAPGIIASTVGLMHAAKTSYQEAKLLGQWIAHKVLSHICSTCAGHLSPDQELFRLSDGRIYTRDSLAKLAISNGLLQGQQSTEFASDLVEQLLVLAARNSKGKPRGWMRQWLKYNLDPNAETYAARLANLTDYSYKLSVMTQALIAGRSEQEAIALARKALFDFSTITPFEKQYIASWWWFYSFSRHNFIQTVRNLVGKRGKQTLSIINAPVRMQQLRKGTSPMTQDLYEDERGAEYAIPLWSPIYADRIKLADLEARDPESPQPVRIYGPPVTSMDALLVIDQIGGLFDPIPYDEKGNRFTLDNTLGEAGRTVMGHTHPILGTLGEVALGGVAPVTIGFGDVVFKGKSVDPKVVLMLQSIPGMWETVEERFQIETIRPGDKGFPKDRVVNQLRGNEYYIINDERNRIAFRFWLTRVPTLAGQNRLLTDFVDPIILQSKMWMDPSYATVTQSLYPNLVISDPILHKIVTLGNYTGAVKLETPTDTVQSWEEAGRYRDATQTLKE